MAALGTAGAKVEINLPTLGWTDITSYVRISDGDGIGIEAGRKDWSSTAGPSSCKMGLTNSDGRFSISNVYGTWWGKISLGVALRVSVVVSAVTYYRFYGYITVLNPRWNQSIDDRWAECEAYGESQRLLPAPSLGSPLHRNIVKAGVGAASYPVAYWPAEGKLDTYIPSAVGGSPMSIAGVVKSDSEDLFPGSGSLMTLGAGAILTGLIPYATGSTRVYRMAFAFPADGWASDAMLFELNFSDGSPRRFGMLYRTGSGGGLSVVAYDAAGAELISDSTHAGNGVDGTQGFLSLTLVQNGANIDWAASWDQLVPYPSPTVVGFSFNATLSSNTFGTARTVVVAPDGDLDAAIVGHMAYGTSTTMMATATTPARGYRKETAEVRLARMTTETGVAIDVPSVPSGFETLMGVQPTGTLLQVCRDVETADGGILVDAIAQAGMAYYSRTYLYYRTVAMTLAWDGVLAHAPTPEYDAEDLVTLAAVTRPDGGTYTYSVTDGRGEFGTSATMNVSDDLFLTSAAQWLVHLGQDTDAFRISSFDIDLVGQTSLRSSWVGMEPGDRIRLSGPDNDLPQTGRLDFMYLGHSEFITFHDWNVRINVTSAQPWKAAIFGEDNCRLGGTGTVASGPYSPSATSVSVTATANSWTVAAAHFPFEIIFSTGEIASVTGIASGGGATKTWTFTRAVNGVATTLPTGTGVSLAQPLRLAR